MSAEGRPTAERERLVALARRLHQDPSHLRALYGTSEAFREICADFATCQEKLESFRHLGRVDDADVQQYVEMLDLLEGEIRARLERAARGARGRRVMKGDGS